MFARLIEKFNTFAGHHQILFTIIVAICVVCISWAIEQILDRYIFPGQKLINYITIIVIGLAILWLTKHFILHVV